MDRTGATTLARQIKRTFPESTGSTPKPLPPPNVGATLWPPQFIRDAKITHRVYGCVPEGSPIGCQNCGNRGFMLAFYGKGDPHPHRSQDAWHYVDELNGYMAGEFVTAECPVCGGGRRAEYLRRLCGLSDDDLFLTVSPTGESGFIPMHGKEAASQIAIGIASNQPAGFVTFWGGYGAGKSHLLKGLVNSFRLGGIISQYTSLADIIASIRRTFGEKSQDGHDAGEWLIAQYRSVPVLSIDEIDKVHATPWALETVFRLIDYRYTYRSNMLTVMASNIDPAGLPDDLQYLASRICGEIVINVGGDDIRQVQR